MTKNNKAKAIDIEFLKSITGDDSTFEKELFSLFIDSSANHLDKIEKALKNSDNEGWYMSSHALKGAAASIGAFDLSKILEYAQVHNKDPDESKIKVLEKIREELKKVEEFIKANG